MAGLAERLAQTVIAQVTMRSQGSWDADVVEFETRSMGAEEFVALMAAAIRAALDEAVKVAEHQEGLAIRCGSGEGAAWCATVSAAIADLKK